ncbi:hypothetical protein [Liquorilactobacillus hordei]|uniref:hypothetical protein n=1 Tax=Liquorilactobacillus hordei TaxID=468911 RepID=UPI001CC17324|nr:hypothetical protein [Liquorilactobacillus hordei]
MTEPIKDTAETLNAVVIDINENNLTAQIELVGETKKHTVQINSEQAFYLEQGDFVKFEDDKIKELD